MLARFARSWKARLAIEGGSMRPTLEDGDWLLVDPRAYASTTPAVGDLVVVADPRDLGRTLVKRVDAVSSDGSQLFVVGDDPDRSTGSRAFGSVTTREVRGRPWFRYWPLRRLGRIG